MARAWILVLVVGCRAGYEAPGIGDTEIPPNCGDGEIDPDEECDDGNRVGTDSCTLACTIARCGDQFVRAVLEQCDDGDRDDDDGCTNSCVRCDDGVVAGSSCTVASGNPATGPNVGRRCEELGGNPAAFADGAEHDTAIAGLSLAEPHYFGMRHGSAGWTWQDSTVPLTFDRWVPGAPAIDANSRRAVVASNGTWVDVDESGDRPFLCTRRIDLRWAVGDDGVAYRVVNATASHVEAIGRCQSEGEHVRLAVVSSLEDLAFVASLDLPADIWVNGRGVGLEYSWADDTAISPELWGSGEPSKSDGCVVVGRTGLLKTIDCADGRDFLCEAQ